MVVTFDESSLIKSEKLSYLKVEENNRKKWIRDIDSIFSYISNISKINFDIAESRDEVQFLRGDTVNKSLIFANIKQNNSKVKDDFFVVSSIIKQ